jgi:nucleoside phosphorylase
MANRTGGVLAAVSQAITGHKYSVEATAKKRIAQFAANSVANYKIGIITALSKETAAIEAVFGSATPLPAAHRNAIAFGSIACPTRGGKGEHKIVLTQSLKMGNNSAAVAAALLLAEFPLIEDILLVGIAGGVPNLHAAREKKKCDDHVRKGDIVVSEQVLQYDMIKLDEDREENRSRSPQPSARLIAAVNRLEQEASREEFDWEQHISRASLPRSWDRPKVDELYDFEFHETRGFRVTETKIQHPRQELRRKDAPLVHHGTIGSANILLKNSRVRDAIRSKYKIRAVEMEGSGVADASWAFGVGYLVVRGVCDYCDRKKDNHWQNHAALVAAAYARAVIERVPIE